MRDFAAEVLAIAPRWRERVFTDTEWVVVGSPGSRGGTFGSFPVTGEGLGGIAKPRPQKPVSYSEHPVAAHEKIASDLAYDIGLPVPPALLWRRENAPRSHGRELVISAIPFEPALTWKQVEASAPTAARVMPLLSKAASSISPFDTWLMNGDRVNAGNLILKEDVSAAGTTIRLAYIDFANSLVRMFRLQPDIWKDERFVVEPYPYGVPPDLQQMSSIVAKIQALPESTIRTVVERVPLTFLTARDRDEIVKALLHRQPKLRTIMKNRYPDLP